MLNRATPGAARPRTGLSPMRHVTQVARTILADVEPGRRRHRASQRGHRRREAGVVFKVVTWDVENLFRVGQPSGPTTPAAYDKKLKGPAAAINEQAPDALARQGDGEPAPLAALEALPHRQGE